MPTCALLSPKREVMQSGVRNCLRSVTTCHGHRRSLQQTRCFQNRFPVRDRTGKTWRVYLQILHKRRRMVFVKQWHWRRSPALSGSRNMMLSRKKVNTKTGIKVWAKHHKNTMVCLWYQDPGTHLGGNWGCRGFFCPRAVINKIKSVGGTSPGDPIAHMNQEDVAWWVAGPPSLFSHWQKPSLPPLRRTACLATFDYNLSKFKQY